MSEWPDGMDAAQANAAILSSPWFRLAPRRSKYNADLWWEYRDPETGEVLRDSKGNLLSNPRQLAFLQCEAPECFFGGSAGGGKTAAVAMDVLRYFDVPLYSALILRRTWTEMEEGAEAIIPFLKEKLDRFINCKNPSVWYLERQHCFRNREGAVIQFAHAENERDIEKRAGTPYQRIYFDELCSFTEYQYDFMFSRQRKRAHGLVAQVPVVMRGTGNPLGVGYEFVRRRFVVEKGPERWFIPSSLSDNVFIDQDDYRKRLEKMPEVLRRKLLDGDWDIQFSGGQFDANWFEIIPSLPPCRVWVRAWDTAASVPTESLPDPDWTVGTRMGMTGSKEVVIDLSRHHRFRATRGEVERRIERVMDEDGSGTLTVLEQQPGAAGKAEADRLLRKWAGRRVRFVPVGGKSKEERASAFAEYCYCKTPAEGRVKIYAGGNAGVLNQWLGELSMFGQKKVKDDNVDSASLGFRALTDLFHGIKIALNRRVESMIEPERPNSRLVLPRRMRLTL